MKPPLFKRAYPEDAWDLLSAQLTAPRRQRMQETAARRTRSLRLVVQDVHQPHNISACLRSADAFGVQLVDIVAKGESFRPSTVARGVDKWLSWQSHSSVESCAQQLKEEGYCLAAGYPDENAVPVPELKVDKPLAVIFGNEHDGVSGEWDAHIDQRFTIPMVGMVESLNISVSCAITLFSLRQKIDSQGDRLLFSQEEQRSLLNAWVYCAVAEPDKQLARLRRK